MALLIGIILLIFALVLRSGATAADRHIERRLEMNTEFLSKWCQTIDEQRNDICPEETLREIFSRLPHGDKYFEIWYQNTSGVQAPYNFIKLAGPAVYGKLPWLMYTEWDALSYDKEHMEFKTAFYDWWLSELRKHGFPGKLFYRNPDTKVCVPYDKRPEGDEGEYARYFIDYSGLPDDVICRLHK